MEGDLNNIDLVELHEN